MDFLKLAKKRYSVRKYKEKDVEDEKLKLILEAGRVAPTAANRQPQRVLVIKSEEGMQKLGKGAKTFGAPMALLICSDKSDIWIRPIDNKDMVDVDASIVTDHMMLQATDLGLGTLWMTWFKPEVLREEFKLPHNLVPVNLLLIGYADGPVSSPERHEEMRKPIEDTVFYESF